MGNTTVGDETGAQRCVICNDTSTETSKIRNAFVCVKCLKELKKIKTPKKNKVKQ